MPKPILSEQQQQLRDEYNAGKILLFNKPLTWTSFDLVRKVKYLTKAKVGHAGTLDPLATGLLIVCTGKATKQIDSVQAQEKEYTGTFHIGAMRPSHDMETEINATFPTEHITDELLHETTKQFTGEIEQVPPHYSAVKVDGKRAYDAARKGQDIVIQPKRITIKEFEITANNFPEVAFRVVCSKGTYIRSLAHDYGKALGSGAYLSSLCRTRIGKYLLKDALEIGEFEEIVIRQ